MDKMDSDWISKDHDDEFVRETAYNPYNINYSIEYEIKLEREDE